MAEQVDLVVAAMELTLVAVEEAEAVAQASSMSTQTSSVGERLLLRQPYKLKVDWAVMVGHLLELSQQTASKAVAVEQVVVEVVGFP